MCALAKPGRVLLKNVDVITLYHDKFAESRKGYRLPQVPIVFQSYFYYPKVVQCYNRGFDGRDVQWECKAELDKGVTFGPINVNCEGYDYPEDDYIVHGSCEVCSHKEVGKRQFEIHGAHERQSPNGMTFGRTGISYQQTWTSGSVRQPSAFF
ncbi:unnamed protein product [Trichobilharzia regenti]|nr:unnamed protein product [Trichobilharzia regenti]